MKLTVSTLRNLAKHEIVSLIGGSAFVFALRISGVAITYLTQVLLARWMGAEELGHYVFALSGCILLVQISTFGMGPAAMRFIPQYELTGDHGKVLGFTRRAPRIVVLSSLVVAGIAICGLLVLDRGGDSQTLMRVLAFCCVPFLAIIVTDANIARSLSLLLIAILPDLLLRQVFLLAAVVGIYVALGRLSALMVVGAMLSTVIVLSAAQAAFLHHELRGRFRQISPSYDTWLWIRTGLPLLAIGAFAMYSQELNLLIAGLFLAPEQLAVYNAAYRTAGFVNYGMGALVLMIAPRLSRLFFSDDRAGLQQVLARQAQVRLLFGTYTVVTLVLLGRHLLGLFGDDFVVGYRALLLLMVANLLIGAVFPAMHLLSIAGYQKLCAVVLACAVGATAAANMILVPRLGIDGGALAVLVVTIGWTTCFHLFAIRLIGIRPSLLGVRRTR